MERRRLRAAALFLCLGVLASVVGGCTVTTDVSLSEQSPGHGTVAVSVALDRGALDAVGGLARLRSQLSVQDLVAAGWTVSGPTPAPGGGAVVTVRHGFTRDAEAGQLLADVAGARVFGADLSSRHTFWRTTYRLSGKVDLTCGVDCFGDLGLGAATGSPVGVDPGALPSASGEQPSSVLKFSVDARLPGRTRPAGGAAGKGAAAGEGAAAGPDGSVRWTPELGQAMSFTATSSRLNTGSVVAVAVGGAVLVLAVAGVLHRLVWARRRRRRPSRRPGEG